MTTLMQLTPEDLYHLKVDDMSKRLASAIWFRGMPELFRTCIYRFMSDVSDEKKSLTLEGLLMVWMSAVEATISNPRQQKWALFYFNDLMVTLGLPEDLYFHTRCGIDKTPKDIEKRNTDS